MSGSPINTDLSIVAACDGFEPTVMRYFAAFENARVFACIDYVDTLFNHYAKSSLCTTKQFSFALEGGDRLADVMCVSWQKKSNYQNVLLVPDFYYTLAQGYTNFLPDSTTPWSDRKAIVFWRGSTTGGFDLGLNNVQQLPRYQLCKLGLQLTQRADIAFHDVVQTRSDDDRQAIEALFRAEGLFKSHVLMEAYQQYKMFVQIDGNGNSWELVRKLRLGCCMLLVDSDWLLWHNQFLRPWEHYVPIKSDLSDFLERVEWCYAHDEETRLIAKNGRDYALSIDYHGEMRETINLIAEHSMAANCDINKKVKTDNHTLISDSADQETNLVKQKEQGSMYITPDLVNYESRSFSQFGEDGVILRIAEDLRIASGSFFEFGIGPSDGVSFDRELEGNFVALRKRGWDGVFLDGQKLPDSMGVRNGFVSALNINHVFRQHAIPSDLDFLSIDVDGQEFWIWMALIARPKVVICEYNGGLLREESVAMQFNVNHRWDGTHYYGASLLALTKLASTKQYTLVWANGVNGAFVRDDLISNKLDFSYEDLYRGFNRMAPDPHNRVWVDI